MSAANREACRRWRAKNRERERERHRQFRAENPDWWRGYYNRGAKVRAKEAVNYAKRTGLLKAKPCEVCGEDTAQAHHRDYSKPLEVQWLCTIHHGEAHHV